MHKVLIGDSKLLPGVSVCECVSRDGLVICPGCVLVLLCAKKSD